MKSKLLLILALVLSLSACATGQAEYYKAIEAQQATETARWMAMTQIAAKGDSTIQAIAMVTMGMHQQGQGSSQIAAPRSGLDQFIQVAGIFVPSIVQGYAINQNTKLGIVNSNNAMSVANTTTA